MKEKYEEKKRKKNTKSPKQVQKMLQTLHRNRNAPDHEGTTKSPETRPPVKTLRGCLMTELRATLRKNIVIILR